MNAEGIRFPYNPCISIVMNGEHILNRKRIDDKLMIETFGDKAVWLEGFSFVKMTKTSHKFKFCRDLAKSEFNAPSNHREEPWFITMIRN